jgi:hypothetical protein
MHAKNKLGKKHSKLTAHNMQGRRQKAGSRTRRRKIPNRKITKN